MPPPRWCSVERVRERRRVEIVGAKADDPSVIRHLLFVLVAALSGAPSGVDDAVLEEEARTIPLPVGLEARRRNLDPIEERAGRQAHGEEVLATARERRRRRTCADDARGRAEHVGTESPLARRSGGVEIERDELVRRRRDDEELRSDERLRVDLSEHAKASLLLHRCDVRRADAALVRVHAGARGVVVLRRDVDPLRHAARTDDRRVRIAARIARRRVRISMDGVSSISAALNGRPHAATIAIARAAERLMDER